MNAYGLNVSDLKNPSLKELKLFNTKFLDVYARSLLHLENFNAWKSRCVTIELLAEKVSDVAKLVDEGLYRFVNKYCSELFFS